MITRRELLKDYAAAGTALALLPGLLQAQSSGEIIKRAIPSSGEGIPMIGLGSSATFGSLAQSEDATALREVLRALLNNGGTVFDTAPLHSFPHAIRRARAGGSPHSSPLIHPAPPTAQ